MQPIRVWMLVCFQQVVFLLEELGVPYELKVIPPTALKSPPFTDLNPNGRVPESIPPLGSDGADIKVAIEDPNRNLVLWESGAILTYLAQQYDKSFKVSFSEGNEVQHVNQWLHFQTSGQGPYYGQAAWFMIHHHERLPSAVDRYINEINRILGVLERSLEGKEWLVGDKMTFADMAFVPYHSILHPFLGIPEEEHFKDFPNVGAWHRRLTSRDSWKKVMQLKDTLEINV
ncbi:unnamed protein product [Clonostachys solani]|uniref:glutathione transferase n=1 Tax=Clonostachys solani TaxID=160281 RepID=A0A9N9Z724_9HYPO|nr:unnamed protein product [Clonostachys solani]